MLTRTLLRAEHVERYHIVATLKQQSLAEHTFNVVVIARAIAKLVGEDDVEIMKGAFVHDLDEIVTGDIPTPTKRKANMRGWDLNSLYKDVVGRELTENQVHIIKLSDIIEMIHFLRDHAYTAHGKAVLQGVEADFEDYRRACPRKIYDAAEAVLSSITLQERIEI